MQPYATYMAKMEFETGIETLTIFLASVVAAVHRRAHYGGSPTVPAAEWDPQTEGSHAKKRVPSTAQSNSLPIVVPVNDSAGGRSLAPHPLVRSRQRHHRLQGFRAFGSELNAPFTGSMSQNAGLFANFSGLAVPQFPSSLLRNIEERPLGSSFDRCSLRSDCRQGSRPAARRFARPSLRLLSFYRGAGAFPFSVLPESDSTNFPWSRRSCHLKKIALRAP
jgi:hypothetical protein